MRTPHPVVVQSIKSFATPFFVCWVLLFLICPAVCSQTDLQASLSGKVAAQQSAKPLAGVAIDLYDESGVKIAEAVSTADGSFLFPAIPQGRHQLRVSLSGFQDYTEFVTLSAGKQSTVDVVLKLKQVNETVEVVAQSPNEIPTTAVAAATLSARTVDVEPVKGDDYQALLPLVPGVVRGPDGRININGSGAIQSGLTVSSSNVADPSTGNPGFELPMDAVESVSVLPNPYSAEYGRFSSGITQIQTRKGESRWGFLVNSIIPRAKWRDGTIMGIERFAPRLAAGGPLIRDRLAFEFGGRLDYDAVPGRTNLSPRAGAVISLLPQSRGVLRGGAGLFYEQTPLNVAAFETYESQTVTRFDAGGLTPVGPPVTWQHQTRPGLRTPSSFIWNVEYDQKLTAAWLLRVNHLRRRGQHAYLIDPIRSDTVAEYLLDSRGRSRYWELELSLNYVRSERFQMNWSYVRSHSETDLNSYDLFFGNLRNPIICPNEYSLAPADVPHRFLFHAVLPIPFKLTFAPMLEIRTGFPYSAIDEYQQFVGQRNRAGRFPTLATLDLRVTRPFKIWRWTAEAGARVYHVLNSFSPRDVQSNVDARDFGTFYNTIPRNFAFTMQFRK